MSLLESRIPSVRYPTFYHQDVASFQQPQLTIHGKPVQSGSGEKMMGWKEDLDALVEQSTGMVRAKGVATKPNVSPPPTERAPSHLPSPEPFAPIVWAASERDEIKKRVASFKAVQEKMHRERDDYFKRTLGKSGKLDID